MVDHTFFTKRLTIMPLIMVTIIILTSLPASGWVYFSSAGHQPIVLFPLVKIAWAGGSDHDNVPPLANGLPAEDLCVKCENSKNVLQGEGLIVGTNHEDFIQGSEEDDQIFGKDVQDIIFADLGIDRVYGGAGGDTVQSGPGNDQIFGEGGDDQLFGGFDDDLIVGGSGNNHMFGEIGNDVLKGGEHSGANYFDCGDGFDVIIDFNPAKGDVTAGNCEIF
jgi:Ca2+-binding RTX toxin-like protein